MRTIKLLIFASLAVGMGCAAMKIGGGPDPESHQVGIAPVPTADSIETVNQEALLGLVAKLEAEINAIKAGRDSFAGLTLQSAAPWSLMPLMAFQSWLSHRREIARIGICKP